jgi:hypothetical protein
MIIHLWFGSIKFPNKSFSSIFELGAKINLILESSRIHLAMSGTWTNISGASLWLHR